MTTAGQKEPDDSDIDGGIVSSQDPQAIGESLSRDGLSRWGKSGRHRLKHQQMKGRQRFIVRVRNPQEKL